MTDSFDRFPKLESPFVREETDSGEYLVTDEVADGYEWVFEDESVLAVEKLDGENVAVYIDEDGAISGISTRDGVSVEPFGNVAHTHIVKGVLDAHGRGWTDSLAAGEWHYGEVVGPKSKENPYLLDEHMWVPFAYARENLAYESWGEYPKSFEVISDWFEDGLIPLFTSRIHSIPFDELYEDAFVEGVVFTHPDGRMAKLRRDMFPWFEGERHG